MNNFKCDYCDTSFSTKSILNTHQKTAKYCISKRQISKQLDNESIEIEKFICKFCDKILTSKHRLNTHYSNCESKILFEVSELKKEIIAKDKEILELKSQIFIYKQIDKDKEITKDKELIFKDKEIAEIKAQLYIYKEIANMKDCVINEIAKQPRNYVETNNQTNTFNNMKPLNMSTDNFSKTIEESFNKDYFIEGQKGAAKFAVEKLLKDDEGRLMYICTDPSRHIYRYKSVDGFLERDVKAKKLTSVIAENLAKKSHTLGMTEIDKDNDNFFEYSSKYLDIKDMENDNGDFRSTLATLVSM